MAKFLSLFTVLICSSLAYSQEIVTFQNLVFQPPQVCGEPGGYPESYCLATEPQSWSIDDRTEVLRLLEPLNDSRLTCFFNKLNARGFSKINRMKFGAQPPRENPDFTRNERVSAWTSTLDKAINFSDKFFNIQLKMDPVSGYEIKKMIVLHELTHGFDLDQTLSRSAEFLELIGFIQLETGQWGIKNLDLNEINKTTALWLQLNSENREEEGYKLMREKAMSIGFPTTYGLSNPTELFADIVAHIFYDPRAKEYLKPNVQEWFSSHVFNCDSEL